MNKEEAVNHMISFVEEAEKELQAARLTSDAKSVKNDIVNNILEKLEKETSDEN